eukprot:TRINITY_DN30716_c0_g1_i1.p1 TRINITY_DN30716_c0_g1~~TRINITY_DN30716_c0_g1_i1.p1  ORF type:complete len:414 (+),score=69.93 TRINITY_DN30716_c0_g1_i1:155-1396(+)
MLPTQQYVLQCPAQQFVAVPTTAMPSMASMPVAGSAAQPMVMYTPTQTYAAPAPMGFAPAPAAPQYVVAQAQPQLPQGLVYTHTADQPPGQQVMVQVQVPQMQPGNSAGEQPATPALPRAPVTLVSALPPTAPSSGATRALAHDKARASPSHQRDESEASESSAWGHGFDGDWKDRGDKGDDELSPELRVRSDSPLPRLAGAIAKRLHGQVKVVVEAMGMACVSRTTRAMLLSQQFLNQVGLSLVVIPAFHLTQRRQDGSDRLIRQASVRLMMMRQEGDGSEFAAAQPQRVIEVNKQSITRKIAGVIAVVTRTFARNPTPCGVIAMLALGKTPASINTGVKAMALARTMLDADGLDFMVAPLLHANGGLPPEEQPVNLALVTCPKRPCELPRQEARPSPSYSQQAVTKTQPPT